MRKGRLTRRDLCGAVGRRMAKLTPSQAAWAWLELSIYLEKLEEKDIPKFSDLMRSIRACTFCGRQAAGLFAEEKR